MDDICPQHPDTYLVDKRSRHQRDREINIAIGWLFLQDFTIHTWPRITFEPRRRIKLLRASFQVYPEFNGILTDCNASYFTFVLDPSTDTQIEERDSLPASHCHRWSFQPFFSRGMKDRSNFFLFLFFLNRSLSMSSPIIIIFVNKDALIMDRWKREIEFLQVSGIFDQKCSDQNLVVFRSILEKFLKESFPLHLTHSTWICLLRNEKEFGNYFILFVFINYSLVFSLDFK